MRRYYLQSGLWMSVLTVLIFGGLYVAADLNATDRPSNTLNIDGGFWSDIGTGFASDKTSGRSTKIAAQNSFSLSLDANSVAGDQAVTSVNTSADQDVSIQVFGSRSGQSETGMLTARVELQVSTAPCPDFDGDGVVGISDFLEFVNHFGTSRGDAGYDAKYDLDENDVIGISDFLIFVNEFGKEVDCSSSGSPDLIVESPSVSDNTLTTGQSFTLSATVRNQGTGSSAATTLRYYQSSDATISTSDTEVGTDSVNGLSASGTSAESISLNAPSSAGTYYYGACVNSVTGESDTDNNCSDAVTITVSAPTSSPDLLIAPGETRKYSKSFSANFDFGVGESLEYRVKSSTVDDGLSGLSGVKVSYKGSTFIFTTTVSSITFSYNLRVSSTVPLNTTLRATIVYDVGTTVLSFRKKRTYTVSLVILVRDSGSSGGGGGSDGGGATVTIADANLRAVITDSLSKARNASITRAEMASLIRLEARAKGIRSLTGLEHATNLTELYLWNNSISDISALSNLTNLTYLSLDGNDISDISALSNLTNLTNLDLRDNSISDISALSNLTNLTVLSLHRNFGNFSISVLSNLTNLTKLYLGNNRISDISALSNLTNLTVLRLFDNSISDISPLVANTGLGAGDLVDVERNPLSSASINTHIPALQRRGVTVEFDSSSSGGGGNTGDLGVANKIYWTEWDTESIRRSDLDGSGIETLVTTGLDAPGGIALDVTGGKMYWTDWDTDKIQRSNLDGSGVEDLITGLPSPYAIALDVAGGKMYWTDAIADKIQRSNLDGSGVEDLITGLDAPGGIALDVTGGKMYWTDGGDKNKIQRSNLDGSGVEDLVTTGLDEPEGIALDVAGGKMYWADNGDTDKIQRSNLDGSGVEDLVTTGFWEPRSIALDVAGGKMYWTHSRAKIQRSNLDGSGVEDLITGLDAPLGIALGFGVPVEAGKDLVVRSSVSEDTLTPGQPFALSVTVRNRGTEQAAATTLRYYRSSNATISTSDTEVGTDSVSGLSAGDTSAESIRLNAPSVAGTYFYGACVDPVTGESNADNNCSSGVSVTVSSSSGGSGSSGGSLGACRAGLGRESERKLYLQRRLYFLC